MAINLNGGAGVTFADATQTLTNKTLEAPVINNAVFTGAQSGLEIKVGGTLVFEGTTADAYETTLSAGDPTADRTLTLPNQTGNIIATSSTATEGYILKVVSGVPAWTAETVDVASIEASIFMGAYL